MKLHKYTIQAILDLYREYRKSFRDDVEINISKPSNFESLIALLRNPNRRKLVSLIDNLDAEVRAELIAVMWIGRGDGDAKDFEKLKKHAKDYSDDGDANYMVAKKPLDEYLVRGAHMMKIGIEA